MHCELVKPYHLSDSFALSTTKEMLTPQNMIVVFKEDNKNTLMSKIILLMTIIIVKDYDILILFLFKLTRLKSTQKVLVNFFKMFKPCALLHTWRTIIFCMVPSTIPVGKNILEVMRPFFTATLRYVCLAVYYSARIHTVDLNLSVPCFSI